MCCESDYIDITGIRLVPGNSGDSCPGNGEHIDCIL